MPAPYATVAAIATGSLLIGGLLWFGSRAGRNSQKAETSDSNEKTVNKMSQAQVDRPCDTAAIIKSLRDGGF